MDYPILSDPDKKVAEAYGILSPRGFSSRTTFVIDEAGKIALIETKVNTKEHGKDLAEHLQQLKFKPAKRKTDQSE